MKFLSGAILLLGFLAVLNGCALEGENRLTAEEAAMSGLEAAGTAYRASIQEAEMQVLVVAQTLRSDPELKTLLGLSFEGSIQGFFGIADWSGTIGPTQNLDLNYVISFSDYAATASGVELTGEMAVAVSQSDTDCSGVWNINDLFLLDPIDLAQYSLSTAGSGIVLTGTDCETMALNGLVNISGDATGNNCAVTGNTFDPLVDC